MSRYTLLLLSFAFIFSAHAEQAFNDWLQNPKAFAKALPVHQGADANFNEVSVYQKQSWRNLQFLPYSSNKAGLGANEDAGYLLELNKLVTNPEEMEIQKLTKGASALQPWSDDYWPIYAGILGKRYADPMFAYKDNWQENYRYILDVSANHIVEEGNSEKIKFLSPSEKYDLLVGDKSLGLTNQSWQVGKPYWDRYGEVETWMGICHGWAPASFKEKRVHQKVEVLAADQKTKLIFYPADIKGLFSLMWANARYEQRFIGTRCNSQDPEEDENGRTTSPECFDNNPASWHLTVVNGMGIEKRSFVFDATYDYQVWNQPMASYEYWHFNPMTKTEKLSFKDSVVDLKTWNDDPYKKYRSPKARYISGVEMRVDYSVEVEPEALDFEDSNHDRIVSVYYLYDLELDEKYQVVGGEWYQNAHPDFIWTPKLESFAESPYDQYISGVWSTTETIPASWQKAAQASSRRGIPLRKILVPLLQRSANP